MKIKVFFSGFFLLFFAVTGSAQTAKDTISLADLVLTHSPILQSVQHTAAAVSVIGQREINRQDGLILTPILNGIAGVSMQQGALNTNRISIRGIGARTQYGTSRLKAYFEEIPLSSAEGETVLEDIDLEALGGIEIIKGPNASSFGAGLGGVISLKAKEAETEAFSAKSGLSYGSFGMSKQIVSTAYKEATSSMYANYNQLHSDGYRQNSAYDRKSLNLFGTKAISEKSKLSFFGIGTRLKAYIPSSLNENSYLNNPESAAASWLAAKGYESYDKLLLGLGWEQQLAPGVVLKSSLFSNYKKGYEARPFDILEDKSHAVGLRSKLNYKSYLITLPNTISLGTELISEQYNFSLYKNLYQSNNGQGSLQGDQFAEAAQRRSYLNAFVQMQTEISKNLSLESGLAFNSTHYEQEDLFSSNSPEQKYTFGSVWSPRLGISYKLSPNTNMYASLSKGFSVPFVAETLTPEGTLNTELKPEVGLNYELGFKGNFLDRSLYGELIFYSTQVHNLLVARRVAEDQYVGINAGESSHQGIEGLLHYKWKASSGLQLNPNVSGSINRFVFRDFVDREQDYSGNHLPAVPGSQLNFGLDVESSTGIRCNASYRISGKMYLDDANSKEIQGYQLLDVKTSYAFRLFNAFKMELYGGIQNALNQKYAGSVLPNAVGFGASAPRYFYPGNPVNYYGGLNISLP